MKMRWRSDRVGSPQLYLLVEGAWQHWASTQHKRENQITTYLHLHKAGWTLEPTHYTQEV